MSRCQALVLVAIVLLQTPWASLAAGEDDLRVPLPLGETALSDIGIYRVAYQPYGGETVEFPVSWIGHFDNPAGVSYLPGESLLGRTAILLHCPWKIATGKAWVDYRVQLPAATPVSLGFGISMSPYAAEPGRSDGVTFSCAVVTGRETKELLREHYALAAWKDFSFDLSAYAGQVITLRLQTEPGPNKSPGFDFSYFGGAAVRAGAGPAGRAAQVARLTATRAYRATAGVSLQALSNNSSQGVTPSHLLPCRNGVIKAGAGYRFVYDAADAHIVYDYEPRTGTLDDFTVRVDETRPFQPAAGGQVTFVTTRDGQAMTEPGRGGKLMQVTPLGANGLQVVWEYEISGGRAPVTWEFRIQGKAITVGAACDEPRISSFSLGTVGRAPLRRTLYIPYLPADWSRGAVSYLPAENVFACRYLDWTVSHASRCPQGEAVYEPKTDGVRNPLRESGYFAVSDCLNEVLPNIPHQPSPYLALLGPCIMLDVWGHHRGTYEGDAENLRELKDNGIDHLVIISHDWQRYGYDVKLPDHIPANPGPGGEAGMVAFGQAANECGYRWSLHENYIDLYPDAPSYDATARVQSADGSPSKAWYNAGTQVQSFGLKCTRALGYAKQNSPEIHRRYKTTAAYLDVHTCVPPWHQLDHEAGQPMAAMALAKVKYDGELFQYMRDTHAGPLFGEGANQFYWAGKCDGVEAQVAGGEDHTPFLDLNLLKLHPQMVNHGMGYYERWFRRGYDHAWGRDTGTVEQVDKYRTQEIAYGHAGFVGSAQVDNVQWVAREHHLMHPVQRLYGTARPVEISYEVGGRLVSGSVAMALGERLRQRIKYDSGLTLWVNWARQPWRVEGRLLPQWGFLALGPHTVVATVLQDDKVADFADCPEYLFADARTAFNMPYRRAPKDIEPRLRDFRYLGGDKISVTYEWVINDTLAEDQHCFVHFINRAVDTATGSIVSQQDHRLPEPTSGWRQGQVLVDGPYEVAVSPKYDSYDLVIGLFRGPRVALKGVDAGGSRVLLGRLKLTRENGAIKDIALADLAEAAKDYVQPSADFTARLYPAGRMVDFGKLATDGSVKVNRGRQSLTVFPYPRDREFTVALDLARIAGRKIDPRQARVRALAARTQQDLGPAPAKVEGQRVVFRVGKAGAGRYVVRW